MERVKSQPPSFLTDSGSLIVNLLVFVVVVVVVRVNRLIHDFLQRDPSTRSRESVHVQVASDQSNHVTAGRLSVSREDCQDQRSATSENVASAWREDDHAQGTSHSVPDNLGSAQHHDKRGTSRGKQPRTSEDTNGYYDVRDSRGPSGLSRIPNDRNSVRS